jgi:hypothetical protein
MFFGTVLWGSVCRHPDRVRDWLQLLGVGPVWFRLRRVKIVLAVGQEAKKEILDDGSVETMDDGRR